MRSISLSVLVACIFLLFTGVFANLYNPEFGNYRNYNQIPRYLDVWDVPFHKFGIHLCPNYCKYEFHRELEKYCTRVCGYRNVLH